MAQLVKNPPAIQETQEMRVPSLGREDPMEEEMAAHSSMLAWGIPWTEEPGGLQSMGSERVSHDLAPHTHSGDLRSGRCWTYLKVCVPGFSGLMHATV